MPTSNPTKTSDDMTASKVVLKKLRHLRRKLTGWILVQGVGKWLIALLAVLAFDMLLDRVFKMDYAQRLIMLVVMAGLARSTSAASKMARSWPGSFMVKSSFRSVL